MSASAPTGKRFAATAVDLACFYALYVTAVAQTPPESVRMAAAFATVGLLLWQAVLLTREGRTLGKRAYRLRVVRVADGGPAGFVRAVLLRAGSFALPNIAMIATGGIPSWLMMDLVVMFWRADRRSLHDLVSGTIVVDESVIQ